MAADVHSVFDAGGPLTAKIAEYRCRPQQQRMAGAVADALHESRTLVVEAGTGTGKTYAYLVPSLLSGLKVIISTGTKHLQDQLYHRDLPVVREALGVPCRTALLKGRANYLCLHRLELAHGEPSPRSRKQARELQLIREWAGRTDRGELVELTEVPEDASVWSQVTSTAENCLGPDCGCYDRCFVVKARRAAQEADLLVVNHHLLCADMVLKEEGFGELLPGADAVILDEAHQLPDIASQFFGVRLGSRQLTELIHDTELEQLRDAGDMRELPQACRELEKAVLDTRLELGAGVRRAPWSEVSGREELRKALGCLQDALGGLAQWLEVAAPRSKGLDACWRRATALSERLTLMAGETPEDHIHWFETHARSFGLHLTPLTVAGNFSSHMAATQSTWIFTSATLTVRKQFDHFTDVLGLEDPDTLYLESPFDYRTNALLFLPSGLPDPNRAEYTPAVIELALRVIDASGGRAFLLFTSYRALNMAAERLQDEIEFPLLVQGSAPRSRLLEQFRVLGNAVLLGTSSFWEGVDVRGPALSCVLIDRLPFASPGEPVLQARIEALRARGGNPFLEHQLPAAVIALKQGIGRLIRDHEDRGLLVLCDPRVRSKSYGRIFLESFPAMPKTDRFDEVQRFFETRSDSGAEIQVREDDHVPVQPV